MLKVMQVTYDNKYFGIIFNKTLRCKTWSWKQCR